MKRFFSYCVVSHRKVVLENLQRELSEVNSFLKSKKDLSDDQRKQLLDYIQKLKEKIKNKQRT